MTDFLTENDVAEYVVESLLRNEGNRLTHELIRGIAARLEGGTPAYLRAGLGFEVPERPIEYGDPRIVAQDKERVGQWVADRIGMRGSWGDYIAIGLLDKNFENIIAGGVFHQKTQTNAVVHIAADGKHAITRSLLRAFFHYCFVEAALERITGYVGASNEPAYNFDLKLGFEHEFTMKDASGVDVYQMVMHRSRCRWIDPKHRGEEG
jgi:hypothetical protein